jgi:hypothetical protein
LLDSFNLFEIITKFSNKMLRAFQYSTIYLSTSLNKKARFNLHL